MLRQSITIKCLDVFPGGYENSCRKSNEFFPFDGQTDCMNGSNEKRAEDVMLGFTNDSRDRKWE